MPSQHKIEQWMKKDSIYLILLILLVLVFFSKVILHPHSVLYSQNSDYVQAHFPLRYAIVNDFEQYHDVPLWLNLDLGFPFLYLYGYPLEWPLLLFPGLGGYEYILHFLILTIGCFYFGKKISLSPYAAFVSAIIVTFSLRVVAHLYAGHSTIVFTFAYIPWLFLAAELIIEKRKVVFALLLAIPLYLALAAEHIHIFFYTSFMLCFYILLRLIVLYTNNIKMYAKPLLCVGIAFLIAVLCSAPVIYKYADFSLYHTRAGGKDLGFSSTTSMHVTNIISLFLPTFFGTPLHYWGFTGNFWEGALYIGLLTIILIIFALRLVRNEHILTFSALALFSLIFAFGTNTPLYMLFHNFIPGFAYFRAPSRMIIFFAFFGAFLAGFGLDEFFSLKSRVFKSFILKIWTIIMTLAVITTLLLLAFKNQFLLYGQSLLHYLYFEKYASAEIIQQFPFSYYQEQIPLAFAAILFNVVVFTVLAVLIYLLLHMSLKKVSAYLKICVVLIVVIDLWIVAFPLIQTKPIAEIYDSNAVIDYLSTDTSLFRVLDLAGVLPRYKQYDKPYAVIDIGSGKFDGLNASVSLINKAFDYKTLTIEDRKLLDVLNVKYILSPSLLNDSSLEFVQSFDHIFVYVWGADNTYETIYLYKNPSVLPRIYFLPDTQLGIEEVNINYSPNRISTEFTAPVNGYLVVLDAYYPSWKASVNNKPVQILRYQEYFRQIPLSAGENHIELMFVPPFGRYARWISIISIFILINMLVIFRKNIFK